MRRGQARDTGRPHTTRCGRHVLPCIFVLPFVLHAMMRVMIRIGTIHALDRVYRIQTAAKGDADIKHSSATGLHHESRRDQRAQADGYDHQPQKQILAVCQSYKLHIVTVLSKYLKKTTRINDRYSRRRSRRCGPPADIDYCLGVTGHHQIRDRDGFFSVIKIPD